MNVQRDMLAAAAFTILLWLLSSVALANLVPVVTRTGTDDPTRVLFVGNSYLYYNSSVHEHVKRMAAAAGVHGLRQPGIQVGDCQWWYSP